MFIHHVQVPQQDVLLVNLHTAWLTTGWPHSNEGTVFSSTHLAVPIHVYLLKHLVAAFFIHMVSQP